MNLLVSTMGNKPNLTPPLFRCLAKKVRGHVFQIELSVLPLSTSFCYYILKGKEKFKDTIGEFRGQTIHWPKEQTTIYKTLHKQYRSSNTNGTNNR